MHIVLTFEKKIKCHKIQIYTLFERQRERDRERRTRARRAAPPNAAAAGGFSSQGKGVPERQEQVPLHRRDSAVVGLEGVVRRTVDQNWANAGIGRAVPNTPQQRRNAQRVRGAISFLQPRHFRICQASVRFF